MGIGKSRVASPLDVDNMMKCVETNQQIETERQEVNKLLSEIREAKETLTKFNDDLEKAIAAECRIEGALKAAVSSCDNIVSEICNAIVKAEQSTEFKATISPEHLAQLQKLVGQSVDSWDLLLANYHSKMEKTFIEHEANIRKVLRQNEGIWFSDLWMKVLVGFFFVYTVTLGMITYFAI